MNSIYTDNKTILTFLVRAQNKIADLASFIVERGGEVCDELLLLLELSDFIESLDSKYYTESLDSVLLWIQEYNYRADLNSIPYVDITGFNTTILTGDGNNTSITTSMISDYIIATNKLIRATPHNSLYGLQGGTINERYHITKQMYDYLAAQLVTIIPASVNLTLTTTSTQYPSGYYELGTTIAAIDLVGSINYNSYKQALYFEYTKNDILLGTQYTNPSIALQPNMYVDSSGINKDTSYSFIAAFDDGVKSNNKYIKFRNPMYYGVIKRNLLNNSIELQKGTKDVRDRGDMSITFTVPVDNTLLPYTASYTPYLFIPFSWGKFSSAINLIFDFARDWTSTSMDMTLLDGSKVSGLLLSYNTQVEGSITFNFGWAGIVPTKPISII